MGKDVPYEIQQPAIPLSEPVPYKVTFEDSVRSAAQSIFYIDNTDMAGKRDGVITIEDCVTEHAALTVDVMQPDGSFLEGEKREAKLKEVALTPEAQAGGAKTFDLARSASNMPIVRTAFSIDEAAAQKLADISKNFPEEMKKMNLDPELVSKSPSDALNKLAVTLEKGGQER